MDKPPDELVRVLMEIGADAARDIQRAAENARTVTRIVETLGPWIDAQGKICTEGDRADYIDLIQQIWNEVKKIR